MPVMSAVGMRLGSPRVGRGPLWAAGSGFRADGGGRIDFEEACRDGIELAAGGGDDAGGGVWGGWAPPAEGYFELDDLDDGVGEVGVDGGGTSSLSG